MQATPQVGERWLCRNGREATLRERDPDPDTQWPLKGNAGPIQEYWTEKGRVLSERWPHDHDLIKKLS